ncbi:MAG: S8 family serine peptidase [Candidatus Eremiobacterota bacterium]
MKVKFYFFLTFFIVILSIILLLPGHVDALYSIDYMPGEILVKFSVPVELSKKEGLFITGFSKMDSLNRKIHVTSMKPVYPHRAGINTATDDLYKITFSPDINVKDIVESYVSFPEVLYAKPNYLLYASETVPNDPDYSQQKDYLSTMNVQKAWGIETGNKGTVIAVVDSGVDWNHSDLSKNMWINSADPWNNADIWAPDQNGHNGNGIDDDNNGFIDDYRGWDFVDVSPSLVYTGEDDDPADGNPDDFAGHGSFVSSQTGAAGNNNIGVAGMSWTCRIMPLRAGYEPKSGSAAIFTTSAVTSAINYAAANGAGVINMSFGVQGEPDEFPSITSAVTDAINKGIVVIAAAGNNGYSRSDFPANIPGVISVGSVEQDGKRSSFSNYGTDVDIYATGNKVYGAYPEGNHSQTGAIPYTTQTGKKTYDVGTGTSFSTPLVSGLAGLIVSRDSSLKGEKLINQIVNYADYLEQLGGKRINVYRSLTEGGISGNKITYNLSAGWNLLSFPFQSVTAVSGFSGSFYYVEGGDIQDIKGKIEKGLAKEISLSELAQLEPGKAYWTKASDNVTASAEGTVQTASSFTRSFQGAAGLKPVGNPYNLTLTWGISSVTLEDGQTLSSAEAQGMLLGTIYYYDTSEDTFMPLAYDSGNMDSGKGYYMLNRTSAGIVFKK